MIKTINMVESKVSFRERGNTEPEKAICYSARVKYETKILRNEIGSEFYSFEFSRSGTGFAGIPDTSSASRHPAGSGPSS